MAELVEKLSNLVKELEELRKEVVNLRKERDEYKGELENMYHAWYRLDLENWAADHGIEITDKLWRDWCTFWMDIYNLEYEQEAMRMAMEDWWKNRHS
jgi:predicted nuclease with TOPRIM domain